MNVINFYGVWDDFGQFSNFAPFPIHLDGERWPTTEHYFQAQKFEDEALPREDPQGQVADASPPGMGRDRKQKLRRDWESVKVGIMREAVLAKFAQHEELGALLLATGDAEARRAHRERRLLGRRRGRQRQEHARPDPHAMSATNCGRRGATMAGSSDDRWFHVVGRRGGSPPSTSGRSTAASSKAGRSDPRHGAGRPDGRRSPHLPRDGRSLRVTLRGPGKGIPGPDLCVRVRLLRSRRRERRLLGPGRGVVRGRFAAADPQFVASRIGAIDWERHATDGWY